MGKLPFAMGGRKSISGRIFDRNGSLHGASGLAVPCFDATGAVCCSLSVAGPTDRIEHALKSLEAIVMKVGEQISRDLGYSGPYPRLEADA